MSSSKQGKEASPRFHGIKFKNSEQRKRYNKLLSRPLFPNRYPCFFAMLDLGIKEQVESLIENLGWSGLMRTYPGYENLVYEFLSSFCFIKDKTKSDYPQHKVSFRFLGTDYDMTFDYFCQTMGFADAGLIHDSTSQYSKPVNYDPKAFWTTITGLNNYVARSNKASAIQNPVLRYFQRIMGCTIFGRTDLHRVRAPELFILWAALNNHPVNTCYYLLDHLSSITKSDSVIVAGGIITCIANKFGVRHAGLNRIEGDNTLSKHDLVQMNFIRNETDIGTFEFRGSRGETLIILPNPARTDIKVAGNLLYVVNPQVPEDDEDASEEGADLPNEARTQMDDEQWNWMQSELQKINTNQQQFGEEFSGMQEEVQRTNQRREETHNALLAMQEYLNARYPPPGNQ
jgi:hypothetical protein